MIGAYISLGVPIDFPLLIPRLIAFRVRRSCEISCSGFVLSIVTFFDVVAPIDSTKVDEGGNARSLGEESEFEHRAWNKVHIQRT